MAKVVVHPDARVQRLLEQVREREAAQGIDRLRLVHRALPARVIVLSNLPLDLTVDLLVTWREVVPSRLARAIARADALPLSKAELALAYPDLWASPEAAKRDLARVEKGAISQVVESIWGLAPYSGLVTYWRRPAQRKPYRAVVRDQRDARSLLELVVGPVRRIMAASPDDLNDLLPLPDDGDQPEWSTNPIVPSLGSCSGEQRVGSARRPHCPAALAAARSQSLPKRAI